MLAGDLSKIEIPRGLCASLLPPLFRGPKSSADIIRKEPPAPSSADIVRPQAIERSSGANWVSQRLPGVWTGIAEGRTLDNGDRELFVAGKHTLRYYRLGKELKLVTEVSLASEEKILSVDAADLDGDGVPEIYLTVMSGEDLASQVWVPGTTSLKKIADKLQYFFRGIAINGKETQIFAQERGVDGEFYGDVYELVKSGSTFTVKNPIKLPRFGYLYNFNKITDAQGKIVFVLFSPDGYLLVYSPEREELWRSSDKFGGSELSFQRTIGRTVSAGPDSGRTVFLDQRIIVTPEGELLVSQNGGFWVLGNSRSYSKSSVVAFTWNGSSLEERWRTRLGQNYLADFQYDAAQRELLLLEAVQKEGLMDKGASTVSIKKID